MVNGKVFIGDSRDLSSINDDSIDLIVTSPPYWHIKNYGYENQIGHGQDLHSYLKDIFLVWKECLRVLKPGRRMCVNIGDQFARSSIYGRYKVIPLHAEIISQMELLSLDYMGSIIWQKRTTMNTSGGAVVMGSYPYPPNGIVEIDYEHILIFKKPGQTKKVDKELKEDSKLTKEEWKELYNGHWTFGGARQVSHEAMFPVELPSRLIRMFTFKGETVLDPFLGSGTSIEAALLNGRIGVGFELNKDFIPLIEKRFKKNEVPEIIELDEQSIPGHDESYEPRIQNAEPPINEEKAPVLSRVRDITGEMKLILENGTEVKLAGLEIVDRKAAFSYLSQNIKGKEVSLEDPGGVDGSLVFMKNRIYVNGEMVKMGSARIIDSDFKGRKRLLRILNRH